MVSSGVQLMARKGHHIVSNRQLYSVYQEGIALREHPSLRLREMPWDDHSELHANTPLVPFMGYHALCRTLKYYEPGDNLLGSMENLMTAIEDATKHPRAHPVEKDLAMLAVHAVDLQRPYIAKSLKRLGMD